MLTFLFGPGLRKLLHKSLSLPALLLHFFQHVGIISITPMFSKFNNMKLKLERINIFAQMIVIFAQTRRCIFVCVSMCIPPPEPQIWAIFPEMC